MAGPGLRAGVPSKPGKTPRPSVPGGEASPSRTEGSRPTLQGLRDAELTPRAPATADGRCPANTSSSGAASPGTEPEAPGA